jgi:hypothetical protein
VPDVVNWDVSSASNGNFLSTVSVLATSQQGGTITYSSDTPTVCTINASTGAVALTGGATGNCTVKATSSLNGVGNTPATNTRAITISSVTLDTVQCAPDAPRVGDSYNETFKARNSAYEVSRAPTGGTYVYHNPKIRQLKDVQATFSYTNAGGGFVNLQTTAVSNSGTAASPAVPTGAWDGWVPLPMAAGIPNGGGADTYVYAADGSMIVVPKRPAHGSVVATNSNLPPVQEFLPADWQRAFAIKRDQDGTAAGQDVNLTLAVTMRETGGFLNRWKYRLSWTAGSYVDYNGATYLDAKYNVTAKFEGFVNVPVTDPTNGWKGTPLSSSNPKQDSAGAVVTGASGKLTYGKMCKFSYRFTRIGDAQTATQGNTPEATPWDNTSAVKTNANGTCGIVGCTAWSGQGHGSNTQARITNSIGDSYGDWVGTFYTHDKLPRVAKSFRSAIGRSANSDAWAPSIPSNAVPMGNWAFFDYHDGNNASTDTPGSNGTTPPTQVDGLMTQANRLVFP